MTTDEITPYDAKEVVLTAVNGVILRGKCHVYMELDEKDEISTYVKIGTTCVDLSDIQELEI